MNTTYTASHRTRLKATLGASPLCEYVNMLNDDDEMRELQEKLYFTFRRINEHMFVAVSTLMCANCGRLARSMALGRRCRCARYISLRIQSVTRTKRVRKIHNFMHYYSRVFRRFNFHEKSAGATPNGSCVCEKPLKRKSWGLFAYVHQQPTANTDASAKQFLLRWNTDMGSTMCLVGNVRAINATLVFQFGRHLCSSSSDSSFHFFHFFGFCSLRPTLLKYSFVVQVAREK